MRHHIITALLLVPVVSWTGVAAAQDTTQTQKQDGYKQPDSLMQTQSRAPVSDATLLGKLHTNNQREIRLAQLAQRNGQSAQVKSLGRTLAQDHQAADRKVTDVAKRLGITLPMDHGQGRDKMQGQHQQGRDTTHMGQRSDTTERYGQRTDTTANPNRIGQSQDTTGRFGPPQQDTTGRFGQQQDRFGQQQDTTDKQALAQEEQRLKTLRGAAFDTAFAQAMVKSHEKSIAMLEQAQNQVQANEVRTLISELLPKLREHRQMAAALTQGFRTTSSNQ